jgi:DNA polymerase III epsilon subunit-like protein
MINLFPRDYIVWDLETSGLDPLNNHILEVAVAVVRADIVVDSWSSLLKFDGEIDPRAQEVHGISKEMCNTEGAPAIDVLSRLVGYIRSAEAHITHNGTKFDIPFLYNALKSLGSGVTEESLTVAHIDTAALYKSNKMGSRKHWRETLHDFSVRTLNERVAGLKYNVGACCDDLGISREGVEQHRALADVLLTNQIYTKLTT